EQALAGAPGPRSLPEGIRASREGGMIRVGAVRIQASSTARLAAVQDSATSLQVPGCAVRGETRVRGRWTTVRHALGRISVKGGSEEYFSADEIHGGLEVRQGHADETFVPFGRRKPIPLREFLRN